MSRDSVSRFSHKAALYDRFRPHYPPELVAFLKASIAPDPGKTVADIAAGTGIFTEQIAQWGNPVFVVEPNRAMSRLARRRLSGFKNCVFVNGTAESTGLPSQSIDLIVSAQAFHWFDLTKTKAEFQRIGRHNLLVAVVWNLRNTDSSFEQAYESLIRTYGMDYLSLSQRRMDTEEVLSFFAPDSPEYRVFEHADDLTFEQLRGRMLSYSFMPGETSPVYEELLEEITKMFNLYQEDGKVRLSYKTRLFIGGIH
ncbi:class I SAM-dependent methyltransferase [Parapedobacter sp. GCM10030251]|uniref:class I SAM-dependent methyltransferase n=1 Tax=Parapedobacter sp. GCM10030251 TaxID=3273419 RepID=UPI00360F6078